MAEGGSEPKKPRKEFDYESFKWGPIKNESEAEKYLEELDKSFRYKLLKEKMVIIIEPFSKLKIALDKAAPEEERKTNSDYNKKPEYQEAKAGILEYDKIFKSDPYKNEVTEEYNFLRKKLDYIADQLEEWKRFREAKMK